MPLGALCSRSTIAFFLMAMLCIFQASGQVLTLVEEGRPRATLVIPDEPLASERFAAEELQTYIKRMSGGTLPIVPDADRPEGTLITVGATHHVSSDLLASLDVEECVIKTLPGRLMIVGGRRPALIDSKGKKWVRDRGTLYGAYEFLHKLGVRWYDPSPIGEVVPSKPTIEIPVMDYRHKPAFPYRGGYAGLWAVRNRYCGNAWGPEEWGGVWYEWLSHMFQHVVPPERFFEDKPEWFPWIDGRRVPEGQLCISNPQLVDRFVQFVLDSCKRNPQLRVQGIEANDGHGWCECEACRALDDPELLTPYQTVSMAPRVVHFNRQIAERVAVENPDAVVGWYIYSDHTEVPRGLESLPGNLHGRVCTYASSYSDYSEPIETGTSPQNERLRGVLESYRKFLNHMSTYEYWSGYRWFGPMPIRKAVAANIRYYERLKLDGVYQLGPRHWGPQGFNYWLAARLLWDPSEDEDVLLKEYCRNFFSQAADPVERYHLTLERAVEESGKPVMSGGSYIEPIFTEEILAEARSLLEEAMAKADQNVVKARIRRLLMGVDFTERAVRMDQLEKAGKYEEALAVGRNLMQWMEAVHPGGATLSAQLAGRYVFASLDSEPGRHLTKSVKKLAEAVKDLGRILSAADVVCDVPKEWRFKKDPDQSGVKAGWFDPELDDSSWESLPIGVWWENAGHPGYDGMAWYRTTVTVPRAFQGRTVQIFFGAVDGDAVVYVNGRKAGAHPLGEGGLGWDEAFTVDITEHVRFGAENSIAVSVLDDAAYGGIWKVVKVVSPRPDAP